jgi:hypothetical protein
VNDLSGPDLIDKESTVACFLLSLSRAFATSIPAFPRELGDPDPNFCGFEVRIRLAFNLAPAQIQQVRLP